MFLRSVLLMTEFEKWLFEVPWRFERYYDMIPEYPMSEEEKEELRKFYRDIFEVLWI